MFHTNVVHTITIQIIRLINFSRSRAVWVKMWKVILNQTGRSALCVVDNLGDSRTRNINIYCFSRQHWLREHVALLRYTYSASCVPCYVPMLCISAVCSVYSAPFVIMCSSALILSSLAVTAVRFELWYHFSTWALRAQYQYTCTNRYSTHVHVRIYSVEKYMFISGKAGNVCFKAVELELTGR